MNFQNQIDYLQEYHNEDMLTGVMVPAPLQKETLQSQIVFRCGLLEPVYSEPLIMQTAITQFFKREQWNITHLVNIILAEYSPIENTDRYSDTSNTKNGTLSRTQSGSGTDTHSGTDKRSVKNTGTDERDITHSGTDQRDESHTGTDQRDIQNSGTDTTTNTISAYNSSTYQPDNKSEVLNGLKVDDDLTHGETINDDITYGHMISDDLKHGHNVADDLTHGEKIDRTSSSTIKDTSSGSDIYTEHTHGNIGVTTNQEMINQELELLRHFDVYDWIAAKLENELFVQVY